MCRRPRAVAGGTAATLRTAPRHARHTWAGRERWPRTGERAPRPTRGCTVTAVMLANKDNTMWRTKEGTQTPERPKTPLSRCWSTCRVAREAGDDGAALRAEEGSEIFWPDVQPQHSRRDARDGGATRREKCAGGRHAQIPKAVSPRLALL